MPRSRFFLLSPANCRGRRAQQVLSPRASFSVAERLRSESGVPIGELFAHMSGLYFRGKLTYAQRFGRAFVITPDSGESLDRSSDDIPSRAPGSQASPLN